MASKFIQPPLIPTFEPLPPLWLEKKFTSVGRIVFRIKQQEQFEYINSELLPKRRTSKATAYESESGFRVLVTNTTTDKNASDFDAVCLKAEDDERWLNHRDQDDFADRLFGTNVSDVRDEIRDTWVNQFSFRDATSNPDGVGLRPPQLGALHATLAHWSLSSEPATIVMPTGTGKTETMLSLTIADRPRCVLVVVPSKALRSQISEKFATLGILQDLNIVGKNARTPVVGIIEHQLKTESDLEIFERCNVVVAVVNSVAGGTSVDFLSGIADRCCSLIFDEAHHVAADSWKRLKDAFKGKRVLQFTATPFREDRSPLGGKVIYNYPLKEAQKDGYFKEITFKGVFEIDQKQADRRIAEMAVNQLREDLANGFNHRLLARCKTIKRAEDLLKLYQHIAAELNPVIVHSEESAITQRIADLRNGKHYIVITVDMLKEGFDMPELKVAALHDVFKSLAVTLQFAGRFPRVRVGDETVGAPTIVANTGVDDVKESLQGLYDEDANWNDLLRDLHFEKVAEKVRFEEFLNSSQDLTDGKVSDDSIAGQLNKNSLIFKFNTVVYQNAKSLNQFGIDQGLENKHRMVRAWENKDKQVVFFVTRLVDRPDWTRTKSIECSILNLFVVYHDPVRELLFIGSSHKSPTGHQRLAAAVSGKDVQRFKDEAPYRIFEGVEHLILNQIGLLTAGGARNVRYSMFSGIDVKEAISKILTNQSTKSNIYGTGFRDGRPVDLGCSLKGKIWCRETGSLNEWTEWCDSIGTRLLNTGFDTSTIIDNVLIPEPVDQLPAKEPWFFEWPANLSRVKEKTLSICIGDRAVPFHRWEFRLTNYSHSSNKFEFTVDHESQNPVSSKYEIKIVGGIDGFHISHTDGPKLEIKIGNQPTDLDEYFRDYPPIITFQDRSALEGARLVDPCFEAPSFDVRQCEVRDWSTTDIKKESRSKGGEIHEDSIQAQAMRWCDDEGFDIIFDDDDANEIADIVALREEDDTIVIRLLHCKYSGEDSPGARVDDIVEVTSQAAKNYYWLWDIDKLSARMLNRNRDRSLAGHSRFYKGDPIGLRKLTRLHKELKKTTNQVYVVQPGVTASKMTEKMNSILGSADSFLRMRANCSLQVWCS